ncbi:hypothetical protein Poly41_40730 [Novipirellula artificiosorum]|uniref:General secretion pathway GspH domain-containing protein n=2 Tax=Novipirellula artificiosorum TaxID=2528016 RepID=A0A5C6DJ50_9BACT|nr:hypothetical protein Poly41_40730 [Novipirellula artificiosorum]
MMNQDGLPARSVNRGLLRRGVTLLEAVMVIVLLSAAAVASSFVMDRNWSARRHVDAITKHVAATLNMARRTAVMNQADVIVTRDRDSSGDVLVITEMAGPFRDEQKRLIPLGSETRIAGSPTDIRFSPMATADRALRWTVSQSTTSGQIMVEPTTGLVTTRLP